MNYKRIDNHTGNIDDVTFYPYQQKTLDSMEHHNKVIFQYGRQMGATTLLSYKALSDLSKQRSVLYLAPKLKMCDAPMQNIEVNVLNDRRYYVSKASRKIHFGGNCIKFSHMKYVFEEDWTSLYDTIVIDCPQFFSNASLINIFKTIKDDRFSGQIILGNSGSSTFKGFYHDLYKNDKTFCSITARRFIHPSFSKEWYDSVVTMLGQDMYRLEYESRFE